SADTMIFQTVQQMSEYGDKMQAEKKDMIENKLGRLKEAYKNQNLNENDDALNELNTAWQAASQEMYAATQQQQQAGQSQEQAQEQETQNQNSKDDEVTDVDFEEVKE
ncbi:MAG: molecular chaperone DnaK, partial [Bacteroidales bacterium]|nr:molecular chaperone DnaK [Bacteroidales bacterium]